MKKTRAAAEAAEIGLKEEFNYANKMNAPEGFCSRAEVLAYFRLLFIRFFFFFVAFQYSIINQIAK